MVVVRKEVGDGLVHSAEVFAFFVSGEWEKCKFGRNRWAEMHAKGGEVARGFLSEELYMPEDRVQ